MLRQARLSSLRRSAQLCALALGATLGACQEPCAEPGGCDGLDQSAGTTFLLRVQLGPRALPYCGLLPPSAVATVLSDPPGIRCGMAGTACEATFPIGTAVTLRSDLKPGARLTGWVGPCSGAGKEPRCALVAPHLVNQVTANVALASSLDVSVNNPGGGGYVQVTPAGEGGVWDSGAARCGGSGQSRCCAIFPADAVVRLDAVYGPLVSYRGMSGACQTLGPSCSLTIKGNARIKVDMPPR